MDVLKRLVRAKVVIVPVILVALAGMAFAARAVTTAVLGADSRPEATGTTLPGPTTSETLSPASTTATTLDSPVSSATVPNDAGEDPSGQTDSAVVESGTIEDETIEVGDVIIEKPEPVSFSNRVTVVPGVALDPETSQGEATPDDESDPVNRTDSAIGASGASSEVFEEGISDRFTIDVSAEPNGHFAAINIAMNNVPDGLVLRVDFGDGDTFEVPPADIERLGGSGTVTVEHRYEPTLTPQPQVATAVATDEGGGVGTADVAFETQAEFLVSFSPLELTALDGCDLFGKGDFELEWNNDGRERSTKFKLNGGETYIEERFRVGHDGVKYDDEPIEVTLGVYERDPVWVHVFRFPIAYELGRPPKVLPLGVRELATHTYPLAVDFHAGRQCNARFDFTVTYAFADPPR